MSDRLRTMRTRQGPSIHLAQLLASCMFIVSASCCSLGKRQARSFLGRCWKGTGAGCAFRRGNCGLRAATGCSLRACSSELDASSDAVRAGDNFGQRASDADQGRPVHQVGRQTEGERFAVHRALRVFLKFTRPHTMLGSAVSICSLSLMGSVSAGQALGAATLPLWTQLFPVLLVGLVPALLMNIYIVGLNQLCDIPVDRVNKPYLPLASGELSVPAAVSLVGMCLLGSFSLGFWLPQSTAALRFALVASCILGTLYSLPPIRLKRFPLLASLCILVVRGAVVNIGFYLHARSAVMSLRGPWLAELSPLIKFTTVFFAAYGIVIALMKDIPDAKGDNQHQLSSFTLQFGERNIFRFCVTMLIFMFIAGGIFCMSSALATVPRHRAFAAGGFHFFAAAWLRWRSRASMMEAHRSDVVYNFYMDIWKLFYLEYVVLPLLL